MNERLAVEEQDGGFLCGLDESGSLEVLEMGGHQLTQGVTCYFLEREEVG